MGPVTAHARLCQSTRAVAAVTRARGGRRHAARYEAEFLADMRELGCREPSVLTRVSDYMGVIIEYVQRILGNGYAYQASGSVYFDTRAFECAPSQAGMPDP